MNKILNRLEKIFYILGIIYFTEPFIPFASFTTVTIRPYSTADVLPVVDDSRPLLIMRLCVLGITLLLTCFRFERITYLVLKRKFFLALIALYPLSFLWSAIPNVTLQKGVVLLGSVLFGLNLAARYTLREQLFILAWAMGLLATSNFLFTLAVPSAGIESGEHAGAWRGMFFQKNPLARMMVLSAITLLLAALESRKYRNILWFGLGFSFLLILLSTSKSSLLVFLTLLVLIPLFRSLRWSNGLVLPLFIILLIVSSGVAIYFVGNLETIVDLLGKDITLTGRTDIWGVVIQKIMKHPWFGYGYMGFWLGMEGDSADVWYETRGFLAPNAHNGFLDIGLQFGFIGLFLFLLTYSKNCLRAVNWLRLKPTSEGLLPVVYLTYILLFNITESTIDNPPIIWVLYSSITTSILTEPILVKDSRFPSINTIEELRRCPND